MKTRLIAFSIFASSTLVAFSQGTVVFNNIAGTTRAPIILTPSIHSQLTGQPSAGIATLAASPLGATDYGANATAASGTGFTAELWAGADAASLSVVPSSQSPLRTGTFVGYITQIASVAVPQVVPGASGTMQIRAWDNVNGTVTTWSAALASGATVAHGASLPFVNSTGGAGSPASSPSSLGMTSFNLFTTVPEPSLIALGALGLGALLLRRRKA